MPRKPTGEAALTPAQRQAKQREKRAADAARWRAALERIAAARTVAEAHQIAAAALVS